MRIAVDYSLNLALVAVVVPPGRWRRLSSLAAPPVTANISLTESVNVNSWLISEMFFILCVRFGNAFLVNDSFKGLKKRG